MTTPIGETTFPGMPADEPLWAVHVHGPDDILAAPDKATAERNAKALNDWYAARTKEPDFDPDTFPRVHAEVIPYPGSRESHAKALAEQEADE